MGKIIRNEKIITPTQYVEKVDISLAKTVLNQSTSELILPENIESIRDYAFYEFDSLKKIDFPSSIKYLGHHCLAGCSYLKEADLSKIDANPTVIDTTQKIDTDYLFDSCQQLISVQLPKNLTHLGRSSFDSCNSLKNLDLTGITHLGDYCFSSCTMTALDIGSVVSIGARCFEQCRNLIIDTLPQNITYIGDHAFLSCSGLKIKEIPSGITSISTYCFQNCSSLTQINFKGNITAVKTSAFIGCSNLVKFTFPNNTLVPNLQNAAAIPSGKNYTGKIAIPNSLYDTWTTTTNWVVLTKAQWIRLIDSWDETITAEGEYALKTDTDLTDVRHLTPAS